MQVFIIEIKDYAEKIKRENEKRSDKSGEKKKQRGVMRKVKRKSNEK